MSTEEVDFFATREELDDPLGALQLTAFPLYVPKNQYDVSEGDYSRNEFVRLLRENSKQPDAIYFLADMLEG